MTFHVQKEVVCSVEEALAIVLPEFGCTTRLVMEVVAVERDMIALGGDEHESPVMVAIA